METGDNNDAPTLNDIRNELDVIREEPIKDLFTRWKRTFERNLKAQKPFSMIWIAGPETKTTKTIDYIREELNIPKDSVIQFTIDETSPMMHNKLLTIADQVKAMDSNLILIIAKGFDKLFIKDTHRRLGHDWEQDVLEDPYNSEWGKLYGNMNKHIVIITTIESPGTESYNQAVSSALGSQFRRLMIELKS